jgi:hypothetical protein
MMLAVYLGVIAQVLNPCARTRSPNRAILTAERHRDPCSQSPPVRHEPRRPGALQAGQEDRPPDARPAVASHFGRLGRGQV